MATEPRFSISLEVVKKVEEMAFNKRAESRRTGLGALYLPDFETTMVRVCKHPDRYRIEIKPDIRRVRLARFPYSVIYRSADNLVQILAVAHLRRRPQYWQQRL